MLEDDSGSTASAGGTTTSGQVTTSDQTAEKPRRAVSRPAGPPAATPFSAAEPPEKPAKRATRAKKAAAPADTPDASPADTPAEEPAAKKSASKKTAAKRSTAKKTAAKKPTAAGTGEEATDAPEVAPVEARDNGAVSAEQAPSTSPFAVPLFQAPDPVLAKPKQQPKTRDDAKADADADAEDDDADDSGDDADDGSGGRRRRRRGGRRRRRGADEDGDGGTDDNASEDRPASPDRDDEGPAKTKGRNDQGGDEKPERSGPESSGDDKSDDGKTTRRRRRRRRRGEESSGSGDDPENTVTKVRERRNAEDEITSVSGSTRLEAKKQRRREGREAGRRRAPIVTEAEFLARRESVKREMVIRQKPDLAQIAVLEDDVLVEHYVARESQTSMIGNVYLGRVQNVLPSMEAAFIDIGKGRNGVLYAGEVDWKALGDGKPRKIEEVLKSGQAVLVQVTKDPIGHKGARLTSQISLAGRFLVYVPGGQTNGISRKLPDTERNRLKGLLKEILPEEAGVIIRTAAEGASEEQLNRDVSALTARWDDISQKSGGGNAPQLLYGEPDLMIKVVRDLFNEDFAKLTVEGETAWDMIEGYVQHVAPDLGDRLERWSGGDDKDVFSSYRIDEQIAKATDRKVWLPSGGSLIIDRTEAMTVVDVNTGKFTGSGGNLEETVTKNNLEAAEEIVRQLRLRDIGGIIVIDFIDMVLENNRDLVLRRLVECLGRDRTRHQVAEVTSLGLVQMTRKRIGTGLVEAFSETCEHCHGRGLIVHNEPVEPKKQSDDNGRRRRGGKGRGDKDSGKQDQPKGDKQDQPKDGDDKQDQSGKQDKPKDGKQESGKQESGKQDSGKQDGQSDAGKQPDPVDSGTRSTTDAGKQTGDQPAPGVAKAPKRRRSGRRAGPPTPSEPSGDAQPADGPSGAVQPRDAVAADVAAGDRA